MEQLLCHLVGDYVIQSDWMAVNKTKSSVAAFAHALTYALCFCVLRPSVTAFFVILATHFIIDRWRLARYVVYVKNFLSPSTAVEVVADGAGGAYVQSRLWWYKWEDCAATGYHKDRPAWLAVWLLIIADNTLHLIINYLALRYL